MFTVVLSAFCLQSADFGLILLAQSWLKSIAVACIFKCLYMYIKRF